jgi:hypothetical protein
LRSRTARPRRSSSGHQRFGSLNSSHE